MALPFFYISQFDKGQREIVLAEDTSRHVTQVLRMKEGELLNLTNGKGTLLLCEISEVHKKYCTVQVKETKNGKPKTSNISIAISLLKNSHRFEWFLEKATELGVSGIFPLLCDRTEKERFRYDRMNAICISAMLQSQQCWLPLLHEPAPFGNLVMRPFDNTNKFIAHCGDTSKNPLSNHLIDDPDSKRKSNCLIAIGPEGDFTAAEIGLALQNDFIPVSLGETRLRTETAGIVAAALLVNRT